MTYGHTDAGPILPPEPPKLDAQTARFYATERVLGRTHYNAPDVQWRVLEEGEQVVVPFRLYDRAAGWSRPNLSADPDAPVYARATGNVLAVAVPA